MRMLLKSILTTFIVYFGFMSILPHAKTTDQLVSSQVNSGSRIQENYQNLFDSVAENNVKKSEMYHKILKQEAARKQQAFDAIKGELQIAQNKNAHNRRNFYKTSDLSEYIVANKREANEDSIETYDFKTEYLTPGGELSTTAIINTKVTVKPNFSRRYHQWRIKAMTKLKERYGNALEATTYRIKNSQTKPGPVNMNPLASDVDRRKSLNAYLLNSFGLNDKEKKEILDSDDSPKDMYGSCYFTNYQTFMKYCYSAHKKSYARKLGGLLFVKNLIARACKADWIATEEIKTILLNACSMKNRFVSD